MKQIRYQTPAVEAFGNCAEEIHWGLIRARSTKCRVIFVFVKDFASPFIVSKLGLGVNRALRSVIAPDRMGNEGNLFVILIELVLTFWCFLKISVLIVIGKLRKFRDLTGLKKFEKLLGKGKSVAPELGRSELWSIPREYQFSQTQKVEFWTDALGEDLSVRLPDSIARQCEQLASKLGIDPSANYVCLHVRETGFYGPNESKGKKTRNGSVENFVPAIRLLIRSGYKVIRLGDPSMTPLPAIKGLIDYPFSLAKSAEMDIWLIENCRFFLGHDSGPLEVANLFQKPTITPNITEFNIGYPLRPLDRGILKHVYSKVERRFLSAQEAIELFLYQDTAVADGENFEFYENSPTEIEELVTEFLSQIESGKSSVPTDLQLEVLTRRRDTKRTVLGQWHGSDTENDRMAARLLGCSGLLGSKFLNDNYFANSRNQ